MRRRVHACMDKLMGVTSNGTPCIPFELSICVIERCEFVVGHVLAIQEGVIIKEFPLHTLYRPARGYKSRKEAAKHFFGWRNM